VLVRNAGSGQHVWGERIADALQVSVDAAEVHKRDHGIAMTGRGVRHGSEHTPSRELASILLSALRAELNDLASEIKRSYEYVLGCYPGRRAADLVLVGGGATVKNLPEYLGEALGIPVRRASDYLGKESCRLQHVSGKRFPLEKLACAVGLAIGT
jgi:Tfp pilus assembly PilM family ATPase